MKHPILLAAVVLAPSLGALAADPPRTPAAVDTSFLKLYAETRGFMLGRPQKPRFSPDGKTVLFLRAEAKMPKMKLFAFDVATGATKELLAPETLLAGGDENLTPEEKARRERQRVSVGGFADYHLDPDGGRVLVSLSGRLYVFDRGTGQAQELKTGPGPIDPKWSPDGKLVGYVRGFDVYVYDLAAGTERAVTTGGTAAKTHGLAEFVAQEEMGRFTGYWWSPDSKLIAYEEADHAGVETWYVADPLKPDVKPQEQFYPRPGRKNVAVRLGIKPVAGGETVWVEWDRKAYEYLGRVGWSHHGSLLLIVQSRNQASIQYASADPKTGRSRGWLTMNITGNPDSWRELPPDMKPLKTVDSVLYLVEYNDPEATDGRRYGIWFAGAPDGTGAAVATAASVDEVLAIDEKNLQFFAADHSIPPEQHVFRLTYLRKTADPKRPYGFKKGETRLTTKPGVNTAVFSPDCATAAFTSTTLDSMPSTEVKIAEPNGGKLGTLPSVAVEPDFQPNVTVEKVGDYWTAVVRPRAFDKAKKYPVLVDVYGGPKHLHVVRAMRNWLIPQWLADQGFVVVAVENRGTPGRGWSWEKAVYGKFGTVPLDDQVKGLHALCDRFPELDRERVGIVGWSFGGYMAANGVLRRPDVFKAAVAGAPVTDWEDYDTHYTERYMGLLPENRKAYDEASLIPLAKDLKRPLLLVHGTADDNVYYRHTLKLSDALFRAGKDFDVLPLPGVTHMYSADPAVAERLWARSVGFFKQHLGEPK